MKMVSEDSTPTDSAQEQSAGQPFSFHNWHADPDHPIRITVNGRPFDPSSIWGKRRERRKQSARSTDGYLTRSEAAAFMGVSLRWMEQNDHAIRRHSVAGPGAKKPAWRFLKADLDAYMTSRSTGLKRGVAD